MGLIHFFHFQFHFPFHFSFLFSILFSIPFSSSVHLLVIPPFNTCLSSHALIWAISAHQSQFGLPFRLWVIFKIAERFYTVLFEIYTCEHIYYRKPFIKLVSTTTRALHKAFTKRQIILINIVIMVLQIYFH